MIVVLMVSILIDRLPMYTEQLVKATAAQPGFMMEVKAAGAPPSRRARYETWARVAST
jgi:hypothetical protein